MSSTTSDGYNKDSFDRYGDDLCELILSYLPFREKFRFESVSKQWKRLVFNKQIILSENIENKYFGFVLKKLSSVKEIEIQFNAKKPIFESIIKKCNHLNKFSIKCGVNLGKEKFYISERQIRNFGLKFGKNLKAIDVYFIRQFMFQKPKNREKTIRLINYLFDFVPNVLSICCNNLSFISTKCDVFFTKLEEVVIHRFDCFQELKTFADNYCKQIKKFHIKSYIKENELNVKNNTFFQFSRFRSVEKLSFNLIYNNLTEKGLKSIANVCKKLKYLCLTIYINNDNILSILDESIFQLFGYFVGLIDLRLSFRLQDYRFTHIFMANNLGNIKSLISIQNLKCFHIEISYYKQLSKHFKDIHLYLPKLKNFKIKSNRLRFAHYLKEGLSKLQYLTTVCFINNETKINDLSDPSICKMFDNCKHIRNVYFRCFTSLTKISIQKFCEIAKRNPKINYRFTYYLKINLKVMELMEALKYSYNDNRDSQTLFKDILIPPNVKLYESIY